MSPRAAATVLAVVLLAIGFVLAVTPLSAGPVDEVACGSAFQPHYAEADVLDIGVQVGLEDRPSFGSYVAKCEDAVSSRRLVAYPLAGVGVLVLLYMGLTGQSKTRWDPPAAEDRPAPMDGPGTA